MTCPPSFLPEPRVHQTRPGSALSAMPVSLSRTMATLYRDPDWSSKNLERAILEARRHVVKDKMPALFPDQLLKFEAQRMYTVSEDHRQWFRG